MPARSACSASSVPRTARAISSNSRPRARSTQARNSSSLDPKYSYSIGLEMPEAAAISSIETPW